MPSTPLSDLDLVKRFNELAWTFLCHLGRTYKGTAPLHTLVDEDPRVRTAVDMASHAFEVCRGSDIESALAEVDDDLLVMDYTNVSLVQGVVYEAPSQPFHSRMAEQVSICHGQLTELSDNLAAGSVTQTETLTALKQAQGTLDKALDS